MNSLLRVSTEGISQSLNRSGLVPLGRAVLIKPMDPEITKGVIVIPDSVKEGHKMREVRGQVMAVGPEAWREEKVPRAVPGDFVLISQWCGVVLQGVDDGEWYRMVNGDDVYCGTSGPVGAQNPAPHSDTRARAGAKLQSGSVL
jgi:co-chaperonin GroES (HSP10)